MAKISRPFLYLGLLALGATAWVLTEPEPAPRGKARPKSTARRVEKAAAYTDEDYKAKFPALVMVGRNTFKPLVARSSSTIAGAIGDDGVPAGFAGGDPNWVCTGTAEVDGRRMALLENQSSGEGIFLSQGDRWKSTVVSQVLPDGVVLVGPGGQSQTIRVKSEEPVEMAVPPSLPPATVPGPVTGPIGNGLSINPIPERGNRPRPQGESEEGPLVIPFTPPPPPDPTDERGGAIEVPAQVEEDND